jgi:hypothetical protein
VVTIHKTWLGKLLQDDSLVRVIGVKFPRWSTDDVLVHLHGLSQLRELQLQDTEITDAGLANLQGLSQLQRLSLNNTNVTDQGVKKLVQALPNCEIRHSAM